MYGSNKSTFADLMSVAKQNAAEAKRKANSLSYDANRPRKADPKQVKLKEGVAKFLAKREEEDKQKKQEQKVKLDKLLQLRNQDRKATNRVRKMLSMTKSANKSCVDDAKDCLQASVAAQGEIQPDEDDYGYTSNYADMMHKKMMDKYKSIPIKPTFADSGKIPIAKSQSLKNGTGWRNKSHPDYEEEEDVEPYEPESVPSGSGSLRKPEKAKEKKPAPPDYQQLLQLAQQKVMEPPAPVKLMVDKKDMREEFEYGRPMTSKEKAAFLADKDLRDRVARRQLDKPVPDKNNNSNPEAKKSASFKIPKANAPAKVQEEVVPVKKARMSEPEPAAPPPPPREIPRQPAAAPKQVPQFNKSAKSSPPGSSKFSERPPNRQQNSSPPMNTQMKARDANQERRPKYPDERDQRRPSASEPRAGNSRDVPVKKKLTESSNNSRNGVASRPNGQQEIRNGKSVSKEPRKEISSPNPRRDMPPPNRQNMPPARGGMTRREELPPQRKEMVPPRREDVPPQRGIPPRRDDPPQQKRDIGGRREMPPPGRGGMPQRRGELPPQRKGIPPRHDREMGMRGHPRMRDEPPRFKPKPQKGRAIIDSDEEYDSEMDDFIDDSEMDGGDISAEISRIFNYDPRRFHYDEESDDECMETSVAEQMREERRSLRLGILEDKEDIAREEEEKKQKMQMMKMKRKVR